VKGSILIAVCFGLGLLLGRLNWLPESLLLPEASTWMLWSLMLLVGLAVGADRKNLAILLRPDPRYLLLPLGVVLGSVAGAWLAGPLLGPSVAGDRMAVAAGFGWYSLSSVLLRDLAGDRLATVALMANIIRELCTLLLAPVLLRLAGPLAPIASGGATAMDSTLPIITRVSGTRWMAASVLSGLTLTLLVPLLVPMVYTWGR